MRAGVVALVGLAAAACSERATRPEAQAPVAVPVAALDASIDGPPPPLPDGWVWAEGPGWRGAFPTDVTLSKVDPPPAPLELLFMGLAVVPGSGRGAGVSFLRWPVADQRADRASFERDFLESFRAQISMPTRSPINGRFQATSEVCTTERYQGRHANGYDVDMITAVCMGAGFTLTWIGTPSHLDETLGFFSFTPTELR